MLFLVGKKIYTNEYIKMMKKVKLYILMLVAQMTRIIIILVGLIKEYQ